MGEITDRIRNNLKDTPNKRIGDVNILYLAGVVEDLKKRIENGVTTKVDKIWSKVSNMPCDVHAELIKKESEIRKLELKSMSKDIKEAPQSNRTLINWLWGLYGLVLTLQVWILFKLH